MKNKLYVFVLLLMIQGLQSIAAQDTAVLATAKYEMTYIVDTTMPESPVKQEMVLLLGKEASLYRSISDIATEGRLRNFFQKTGQSIKESKITLFFGEPACFYKQLMRREIVGSAMLGGIQYQVTESLPVLDWHIEKETKKIGGYTCQKATAEYKGRSYEVWFCQQLPFNNGPWKLGGLPGLILEAADTKREWVIRFISFEEGGGGLSVGVKIPDNGFAINKIGKPELVKLLKAFRTDPNGFLGMSANSGMIAQAGPGGGAPPKRKSFNNTLEKE